MVCSTPLDPLRPSERFEPLNAFGHGLVYIHGSRFHKDCFVFVHVATAQNCSLHIFDQLTILANLTSQFSLVVIRLSYGHDSFGTSFDGIFHDSQ